MELYILKIGGSVATEKDKGIPKAREDVIRRIVQEIEKARAVKDFKLVIVCGAGPFGHKFVADYKINEGVKSEKEVEGFVRTHRSVERLNNIFVDVMERKGMLPFPVQPSACIKQEKRRIVEFDTAVVEKLLELDARIIPIMYGDMVLDSEIGASVVSGDAIVPRLAKALKANKVFLGTDVEGIFSEDPKKSKKAELVGEVNDRNLAGVLEGVGGSSATDVTGGMKGKLLALKGVSAVVFNLAEEGNLFRLLKGGKGIGTEIRLG